MFHFLLFFIEGSNIDAYGIFIDSGSPDSYLSAEVNNFLNDTIFNGTFNLSSTSITNATDINSKEDVAELIIMAVTSVLLGLMILITVIGKRHREYRVNGFLFLIRIVLNCFGILCY